MSGKASAAGQDIPLEGQGSFDLKAKRGHFTMTTSVPGKGGVKIEEILDGLVIYMHSDALTSALPAGKKWLKIDLKTAAGKSGVDFDAAAAAQRRRRPDAVPSYLAKAGDVHKVGSEDVNGTPTTHYRATIDFDKLAGSAGKAADSVRQLERSAAEEAADRHLDRRQPARAPPDGRGHRRSSRCRSSFSLQIDYKRFGVPVDVQAPAAGETSTTAASPAGG